MISTIENILVLSLAREVTFPLIGIGPADGLKPEKVLCLIWGAVCFEYNRSR